MKLKFALFILLTMLLGGMARAATTNFNGTAVSGCDNSSVSTTYTCNSLPQWDASVSISSGYTVVINGGVYIGYNQGLQMSGTAVLKATGDLSIADINPSNLTISGGTLEAGGTFSMGAQQQNITANIKAATARLGTGSNSKITGTITVTGQIDIASHVTIVGPMSATTITTGSPVTITGNVTATNSFALSSGGTVNGNISTATLTTGSPVTITGNVAATNSFTLSSGGTVTGNVSGGSLRMEPSPAIIYGNVTMTGDVSIGSGNTINGDLTARNVSTDDSNARITGNATVNSIYFGYGGKVDKNVICAGNTSATCTCVTRRADYNYTPTCAAATPAPAAAPDHIQITHAGTALTCQPQTVTITACANAACTAPHYTGGATVTLGPGPTNNTFTIDATGINSAASVQQSTATPTGGAGTSLTAAVTGLTKARTCVNSSNTSASDQCAMTFSDSGLVVTSTHHLSGQSSPVTIRALTASDTGNNSKTCLPLFKNQQVPINLGCTYVDPTPANAASTPMQVTQGSNNTSFSCGSSTSPLSLTFDSAGSASPTLIYNDVGTLTLNASYTSGNLGASGSSSNFMVAPYSMKLEATRVPTTNLKVDTSAPIFAKAGEPFTLKVTALNFSNNPTKNFGKEIKPSIVKIESSIIVPTASASGTFTNTAFTSFTNGAATSQWTFSDVGKIRLVAKFDSIGEMYQDKNFLGFNSSVTLEPDRFIPDHFDTTLVDPAELNANQTSGLLMSCSAATGIIKPCAATAAVNDKFIYSGQGFFMKVTAYNAATPPAVTANYNSTSGLSKPITLSGWTTAGGATATNAVLGWGLPITKPFAFAAGVGTLSSGDGSSAAKDLRSYLNLPFFTIPAASAPVLLYLRATDTDNVSSLRSTAANSVETALTVVNGQMLVTNNYGAENSAMPIDVLAQYWTGSTYVFNAAYTKAGGVIPALASANFSKCQGGMIAGTGCKALELTSGQLLFLNGKARFGLKAPGVSGSTSITLPTSTIPFLPSTTGRETFGVYRSGPVIYTREVY